MSGAGRRDFLPLGYFLLPELMVLFFLSGVPGSFHSPLLPQELTMEYLTNLTSSFLSVYWKD